jgi:hypothetical protein
MATTGTDHTGTILDTEDLEIGRVADAALQHVDIQIEHGNSMACLQRKKAKWGQEMEPICLIIGASSILATPSSRHLCAGISGCTILLAACMKAKQVYHEHKANQIESHVRGYEREKYLYQTYAHKHRPGNLRTWGTLMFCTRIKVMDAAYESLLGIRP